MRLSVKLQTLSKLYLLFLYTMRSTCWLMILVLSIGINHSVFIGRKRRKRLNDARPKRFMNTPTSNNDNLDLNLDDNQILNVHDTRKSDSNGIQSKRRFKTQQKYRGLPIFGASLVIEQEQSRMKPIFGKWFDKRKIARYVTSITPMISESQAIDYTLYALNITQTDLYVPIAPELYIYHQDDIPVLAYITRDIEYQDMKGMVILNANTGDIIAVYTEQHNVKEACGTGGNGRIGQLNYCSDNSLPDLLILDNTPLILESERIRVYDNNNNPSTTLVTNNPIQCILQSSDNSKCDINDNGVNGAYCAACDVFAFGDNTFDMYENWMDTPLGQYPVTANLIPLNIYVHIGTNYANAFFSSAREALGFGDGDSGWYPLTVADITAHEIAHAFTDKGSNLIYSGESGGMNEAYSDIVGECLEYYIYGNNDWKTGADVYKSGNGLALRYMYNPPLDGRGSIDQYSDFYPSLNVHYSSGLYNKASYLLRTQYQWSMQEIFKVFSTANLYYWTADSTFNEGVCGLQVAALDVYPDNVVQMQLDIANAFQSVGLSCPERLEDGGTLCNVENGLRTYCIYRDIIDPETVITIKSDADAQETDFEIHFAMKNGNNCNSPRISLEFEQIDYNTVATEYLKIYDDSDNEIETCTGQQYGCGVFEYCLNNYQLATASINNNEEYIIRLKQGPGVHRLCDPDPNGDLLSVNAVLTMTCEITAANPEPTAVTISPTDQPTNQPSINPTNLPTMTPTIPSKSPTEAPSPRSPVCCRCLEQSTTAGGTAECQLDTECRDTVCTIGDSRFQYNPDPYCCNNRWDGVCVNEAQIICNDNILPTSADGDKDGSAVVGELVGVEEGFVLGDELGSAVVG